jgi:peptide/nickel transport system substrate-binding protein
MELTNLLKDQLKKDGIELEHDVMDWAAHTKIRRELQYTLYSAGMGLRSDPNQIYYADMYSKSRQNGSGYNNPEVDRLLDKANEVYDPKERKQLYTEVVKYIQRDVPEIYLYLGDKFLGVQPQVKNFSTGGLEERVQYMGGGLPYTWLDK